MFCDNCGQQNPDNARFCTGCGRATDGSAPAQMPFAAEMGSRFKGAVSKNSVLTVNIIAFYLGLFSLTALVFGALAAYIAITGSLVSAGPLGDLAKLAGAGGVDSKLKWAGILGLLGSLLGAYGLASARGLFGRQAWAREPAFIAAAIWAVAEFLTLFAAGKITGGILLLVLLRTGIWTAIAFCLTLPSVKEALTEE